MDPTREEEKREGEERWWRTRAAKRREERWWQRRAAKRREERWWRRRAAKRRNLPPPIFRREGKGREAGQAMAAGQADPPTPSSNLGLRIHPCPRLPPPSPAPPPQPPLPPSPLARPTPAPLPRPPRAPRAADAGGGGEVSSEEWQRRGTYSPLPSVVASIVHQLLEMESVAGEKTSGVADRPVVFLDSNGRPAAAAPRARHLTCSASLLTISTTSSQARMLSVSLLVCDVMSSDHVTINSAMCSQIHWSPFNSMSNWYLASCAYGLGWMIIVSIVVLDFGLT